MKKIKINFLIYIIKMETYFDLIPRELTNVILNYVDIYDDFVNLYELTNLYINGVLTKKFFWTEYLRDRLDEIYEYVPTFSDEIPNHLTLKFYYLSSHTFRILNAYEMAIDTYNKVLREVNRGIKKYYPSMTVDNIDYEKIEDDDNYDNLIREGISIELRGKGINNLSILYNSENALIEDLVVLSKYIAEGMTIDKIELYMSFQHYSALLKMADSSLNIQGSVHIPFLSREEYIGLLIQSYFNGVHDIIFKKMA